MGVLKGCRDVRASAVRSIALLPAVVALASACTPSAAAIPLLDAKAILQELRAFRVQGSALFIAAHPDDENTQLIAYLARSRGFRTAYLSITRGDGGQNLLGPEFGEQLGVVRTQELLAARRIDGGRQFFTRAIDFGFSKSHEETLSIWDRRQAVGDVVRVIRTFRPDVIITRFSPQPSGTHGHHTASAVLGVEAFNLAGDPQAFPEQLGALAPWQPKRIVENGGGRWRGGEREGDNDALRIDVSGDDPATGLSLGEIAGQSRAMHKSQGFGGFGGFRGGGGPRFESFEVLGGEPATMDIFDGVDATWNRVEGGAEVDRLFEAAIANFKSDHLAANVPALLEIRAKLAELPDDPIVDEQRRRFDRILQACVGLSATTTVSNAEVVPGEPVALHHAAESRGNTPIRWVSVRYPVTGAETAVNADLRPGMAVSRDADQKLPVETPPSQPYWLREPAAVGMYRVDDPSLIGMPENPPVFPCEYVFTIGGQTLAVAVEPSQVILDSSGAEHQRALTAIPPASVEFASPVRVFAPGAARDVEIDVAAFRPALSGEVRLGLPTGWTATPATHPVVLANVGDRKRVSFDVVAPAHLEAADITACIDVGGAQFGASRIEINYDHIPRQLLQPQARVKAVSVDLAIRGEHVGYIPGAGDSIADCLEQMGYRVTQLTGADLVAERLRGFDAVILGVRALNTRSDLADGMPALFDFAHAGGVVIVQYNRPDGLRARDPAPYELRLSSRRVTDENAAVQLLAPEHPALNEPNKISRADFAGWVQERGLYFPDRWDENFTPLLACSDPGEAPLEGGLLVARHGQGYFVYTALAWFRQLPAGVPGAYRLFANLVSLGK